MREIINSKFRKKDKMMGEGIERGRENLCMSVSACVLVSVCVGKR